MCVCAQSVSHVQLFETLWTVACQPPLATGFSGQKYWSGLSFPPPGHLPDPETEPTSPTLAGDSLQQAPPGKSRSKPCTLKSLVAERFPLA